MSWSDVDFEARWPDGDFDHSEPRTDMDSSSIPRHRRAFAPSSLPLHSTIELISTPPSPVTTTLSSLPATVTPHTSYSDSYYPNLFSFPNVMPSLSQPATMPIDQSHLSRSISNVSFSTITTTHEHEIGHRVYSANNIEMSEYMDPEVYRTVAGGDLGAFKRLLQNITIEDQSLWSQISPQGNTILHLAAASGHLELARLIVQNQKQLNLCKNFLGDLPLHVAASAGHVDIVKALLTRDDVDDDLLRQKNNEGDTPLHMALRKHHQQVAEFLVKQDPRSSYLLNKSHISPLYMAAESRYHKILNLMMDDDNPANSDLKNLNGQLKGKSLVHAALRSKDIDILSTIIKKEPTLLDSRNGQGMSPMFFAASTGYYDGVCKLIEHSTEQAYQKHSSGFYPIHIAAYKGHVNIVKKLLEHCPDSMELLVSPMEGKKSKEMLKQRGQNILHLAAKGGRARVVSYFLKVGELGSLINHKDLHGNTPLHLAVMNWHPKIASILTWDTRVNLELVNNDGFTALDIVERVSTLSTYRQRLTWMALLSAGAPRANLQSSTPKIPSNGDKYNNRINTLLLMATLVATVTFAAGFTLPGGNASNPDQQQQQGMANLGSNHMFQVFVTCDTIALYSSIVVAVMLIWAQQSDLYLVSTAFKFALPLLGITLTSMSLAFMAGVHLVVSNVKWLAHFVLITGLIFLASFLVLFVPLFLPYQSRTRIVRLLVYYPFCFMVVITASNKR